MFEVAAVDAEFTGVLLLFMLPDKIDVPEDLLVYLALSLDLDVKGNRH